MKVSRNLSKSLAVIALTLLITTVGAAEKILIQFQAEANLQLSKSDAAQGIINKYRIDINPEVLYQAAKIGPHRPNSQQKNNDPTELLLFSSTQAQEFNLNSQLKLTPNRFGQYIKGVDTFSGTLNDDETTTFVLSIENNQVSGQIQLGEYLIKI